MAILIALCAGLFFLVCGLMYELRKVNKDVRILRAKLSNCHENGARDAKGRFSKKDAC